MPLAVVDTQAQVGPLAGTVTVTASGTVPVFKFLRLGVRGLSWMVFCQSQTVSSYYISTSSSSGSLNTMH